MPSLHALVLLAAAVTSAALAQPRYAAPLEQYIAAEMRDKQLPGVSIALVDGDAIVWSKGFGDAAADSIHRAGSVSKLFTGIAVMQLAERGLVDLDAPVSRYLAGFRHPVTLRQLLSHRAGLLREPPAGHYFDSTSPSLAATVRSLNDTELVYPPGTHTKYSNAGVAVAGAVVETVAGEPFAAYVKRNILEPYGMRESAFTRPAAALAKAEMWTYDGRVFPPPRFEWGMSPAASLYSTAPDLGRFVIALFAGGAPVLKPETLHRMWAPQLGGSFGLSFILGSLDGQRVVGHSGAVYGYATEVAALPDEKLGAVVIATRDSVNGWTRRVAQEALRMMLAERQGRSPVAPALSTRFPAERLRALEGSYGEGDARLDAWHRGGELYALPARGGNRMRLRERDGRIVADDVFHSPTLTPLDGLARRDSPKPPPPPAEFAPLIGEYGWDYDVLYLLERDGLLTALIEWYDYYPLAPAGPGAWRFPAWGLYDNETLTVRRDAGGAISGVLVGGVFFPRRSLPGSDTFRIKPVRPVAELRRKALALSPPAEKGDFRRPELVELIRLDPTLRLDIRYASTNNFLSTPVYRQARAFLQRPAAEAVVRAHQALKRQGYGLLIHDAYRPWYITKVFWDATPPDKHVFVADPSQGSRHNRGCAVDLTLFDLATGKPVRMTGGYDEMSDRSYPDYPGGGSLERWHRDLLRHAFEAEGFEVYEAEWWHFDYREWQKYSIGNVPFEKMRSVTP